MNEKMKKCLTELVYRVIFALGIFFILFGINFFAPSLTEKISPVWTENTNFQRLGNLFSQITEELFPF